MQSDAATVEEYLASLPDDRAEAIAEVRDAVAARLPAGMEEVMRWGMICWEVPLSHTPDTYNGKPLMYAALASQKRHMAVYLTGVYTSDELREEFEAAWRASGKRVDMGKSCIRFRTLADVPLDLVEDAIGRFTIDEFVDLVEAAQGTKRSR